MAITFAGAGAESFSEIATHTFAAPASPATDDVWIAVIAWDDEGDTPTLSDWTDLANSGGTGDMGMKLWYFRYAGSTPNLDASFGAATPSSIGGIGSFRGVKTTGSPANVVGTVTTTGTASTTIAHAAISPSVEECCLLVINGATDDNTRTALGGDFAVAFDQGGGANCFLQNLTTDMSVAMSYDLSVASGTTGTINQTQSGSDDYSSVLIALEPADGAPAAGQPYAKRLGSVAFVGDYRSKFNLWRGWLAPKRLIPILG